MSGPTASPSSFSATGTAVIAERLRNGTVLGVDYVGICCGAGPHHVRAMAEALGREVPAGKYSPALELHPMYRDAVTARDAELRGLLERLTVVSVAGHRPSENLLKNPVPRCISRWLPVSVLVGWRSLGTTKRGSLASMRGRMVACREPVGLGKDTLCATTCRSLPWSPA